MDSLFQLSYDKVPRHKQDYTYFIVLTVAVYKGVSYKIKVRHYASK